MAGQAQGIRLHGSPGTGYRAGSEEHGRTKSRTKVIHRLLRDMATTVQQRATRRNSSAKEAYVQVQDGTLPWNTSPTVDMSPKLDKNGHRSKNAPAEEIAGKGLGPAWHVQVP